MVDVVPVDVTVYPKPVVACASTVPPVVVLTKSISSIWFLTGTTSFEFGITVIRICVDEEPSTSDTAEINNELVLIVPLV